MITFRDSVMIVSLHRQQRVYVSSYIHFQHHTASGRRHEVVINDRQFLNLNDYIHNSEKYSTLTYIPLGGAIWLFRRDSLVKLIDNRNHSFFWFYKSAWSFYIRYGHASVYYYVRRSTCRQLNAKYESQSTHFPGRNTSHISKRYKILSRSPRNDCHENDKRTQHSIISRWNGATAGTSVRHRSGKDASRFDREIKTDREDAEFSSDGVDTIESCSECSVEEVYMSTEDQVD